jgi:hypothetical protein
MRMHERNLNYNLCRLDTDQMLYFIYDSLNENVPGKHVIRSDDELAPRNEYRGMGRKKRKDTRSPKGQGVQVRVDDD